MRDKTKHKRYQIASTKKCECGCGGIIYLRGWHFEKYSIIPKCLIGHNKNSHFKKNNKAGWKGGKIKCNGYWLIYKPNHPHANAMGKGYVRQVRLLMEEKLGRYLTEIEFVHHINGIKDDDRIENLVVLMRAIHSSLHHKEMVKNRKRNGLGQFVKEAI